MNKKIYSILSALIIIFLCFIINIKHVFSLECVYGQAPVYYYLNGNSINLLDTSKFDSMKMFGVKYSSNGKQYQIYESLNDSTFKDSNFNKTALENAKCPSYAYVSGTINRDIKEISAAELSSYQSTYLSQYDKSKSIFGNNTSKISYPLYLISQDGVKTSQYFETAANYALNDYTKYLNQYESQIKTNCNVSTITEIVNADYHGMRDTDFIAYATGKYGSTTKNEQDKNISESCWNSRSTYVKIVNAAYHYAAIGFEDRRVADLGNYNNVLPYINKMVGEYDTASDIEEKTQQYEEESKDYCSLYCELDVCSNFEGDAYNSCMGTCDTNNNDCNKAFNECKSSTSKKLNWCLKEKMGDYHTAREEKLESDKTEIDEANEMLSRTIDPVKKFTNSYVSYELTCDDVEALHIVWVVLWIAAPVLLIIMGTLDFARAVIADDVEKMNKARKKFPKRVLAAIILALIPTIITLIVSIIPIEDVSNTNVMYCVIKGSSSTSKYIDNSQFEMDNSSTTEESKQNKENNQSDLETKIKDSIKSENDGTTNSSEEEENSKTQVEVHK